MQELAHGWNCCRKNNNDFYTIFVIKMLRWTFVYFIIDKVCNRFKNILKMKISLNQPNGFSTHFGPDSSKYLDVNANSSSK